MRKQSFKETVKSDETGLDTIDSEILAWGIEKTCIEILDFNNIVNHIEGGFEYLWIC